MIPLQVIKDQGKVEACMLLALFVGLVLDQLQQEQLPEYGLGLWGRNEMANMDYWIHSSISR
jgi:hypothetical protein